MASNKISVSIIYAERNILYFLTFQTRQWSIRGANRNIEKIKKKLVEQVSVGSNAKHSSYLNSQLLQ